MKFRSTLTHFLFACSIVSSYGCAALQGLSAGQEWSENYALADGVRANDPAIIDGNVETVGQSQYIESSGDTIRSYLTESESIVTLPAPRSIHRIVVHSSNLEVFDLLVMDAQGKWGKIEEVKGNKQPFVDFRLNRPLYTAGVKIRVRRTSDDAEQRRKNVHRVGGFSYYSGKTHALAKIAEVELYGFVSQGDRVASPFQTEGDTVSRDSLKF